MTDAGMADDPDPGGTGDEEAEVEEVYADVLAASLAALTAGPRTLAELTAHLRETRVVEADWEEGDVELALLGSDECYVSETGLVAASDRLLDGAVLTHRLTASELGRGMVDVTPDLGVLDWDLDDGFAVPGGGWVETRFPFEDAHDADVNGSLVGPDGWLDGFAAGDLVAFRRHGDQLVVGDAGDAGDGAAEEAALRRAWDVVGEEGVGVEPSELLMEAWCADPSLFRAPVAPVGELLARMGLVGHGAWYGPAGEEWAAPGVLLDQEHREEIAEEWDFDPCCRGALAQVIDAWRAFIGRRQDDPAAPPATAVLRPVANALGHGAVAPAFAEYVLGDEAVANPVLAAFATELATLSGRRAAAPLLLRALNAERAGRTAEAEQDLEHAATADPEYSPALAELAWYAADRGDAARAAALLQRAEVPDEAELAFLSAMATRPAVVAGRNDPCPCGSGRKYKQCCMLAGPASLGTRAPWVHHKLVNFTVRPARAGDLEELLEVALGVDLEDADPGAVADLYPWVVDVAAFEGGAVERFADERGVLLPADELALVRSWVGAPLALWEVTAARPGESLTLRHPRGAEVVATGPAVAGPPAAEAGPGDRLLARVVPVGAGYQIVGPVRPVAAGAAARYDGLEAAGADEVETAAVLGAAFAALPPGPGPGPP